MMFEQVLWAMPMAYVTLRQGAEITLMKHVLRLGCWLRVPPMPKYSPGCNASTASEVRFNRPSSAMYCGSERLGKERGP
eukprot:681436-Pyramimonas_sp.AAC.1